jgi:hypothetical protein
MVKSINLGLAFFLELAALMAFAFWGYAASESTIGKILLGIGVPLIGVAVWGIFAAPRSKRRLKGLALLAFKIGFFALAVLALIVAGSTMAALILAVVAAINLALAQLWKQEEVVNG